MSIDFTADMDNIFLGADSPFREQVTYAQPDMLPKQIYAVVNRYNVTSGKAGRVPIHKYRYEIYVSKTDIPSVNKNTDQVTISKNGSDTTYQVGGILYEDAGSFKLGLV